MRWRPPSCSRRCSAARRLTRLANVALAASVTGATAALWYRDGAGWAAVGLLGGWTFLAGAVFRGGLVDVAWRRGALAPGVVADGAPAWLTSALFIAVAIAAVRVASEERGRTAGVGRWLRAPGERGRRRPLRG